MAHYAFLDNDSVVTHVIVGRDETETVDGVSDWESYYAGVVGQRCVRTSYWTYGGQHLRGGVPFRMNFASPGFTYNELQDAFIAPRPDVESTFDEATCLWVITNPKTAPESPAP
jgi:hypothetical protein